MIRQGAIAVMCLPLLAGLAAPGQANADRDVLWRIVHEQCVPDQLANREPAPCTEVDLSEGPDRGYAVFKDMVGERQYLVIPTVRVSGMDDPSLLDSAAPQYFSAAWRARSFTEARAGGVLPRDWVSLAVNAAAARSQDQLHIHVDCLAADVHGALEALRAGIGPEWSALPVPLHGRAYEAVAIDAGHFDSTNLFALAAAGSADPALLTVIAVGSGTDARPGFILLRHRVDPAGGDLSGSEELQDHTRCPTPLAAGPFTGK